MTPDDVVWVKTDADQTTGTVMVDVRESGGSLREDVENASAYGHGGVLPKDTAGVMVRSDDGGVLFAAVTARPSWADEVSDVYSATAGGRGLRVSDVDDAIEMRGAPVTLGADEAGIVSIARDNDGCYATLPMQTWMNTVTGVVEGVMGVPPGTLPIPTTLANVVSASQHKASD
uniref:Uncharacterized protein n=1 Tax=viral metagenome TaxID=1070528 RepID=A0A6M3KGY8_9ZZZZ